MFKFTFSPGALDVKTKMLIAMAINASTGMGYGCSEIAKILQGMDTTKEEIAEALRVAATVRAMVSGSPAWNPHAMLAEEMDGRSASSSPAA